MLHKMLKLQYLIFLSGCVTLCFANVIKTNPDPREDASISCVYQPPTGMSGYTCQLSIHNPNGHNDFTNIGGEHLAGFTNADVERLYITYQNTSNIPSIICESFPNILDLIIGSSHIQVLDDGSFAGCGRLEFLMVGGNNIRALPNNIFTHNSNLQIAILSDNGIQQISDNVFSGTRLSYIDLGKNSLRFFNPNWFSGIESTLEVLLISYNQILGFPSFVFDRLVNLRELDISVNPGTILYSDTFLGLSNLRRLYMSGIGLTTVNPAWFRPLTAIEHIYLSYNRIRDIPDDSFDGLSTLQSLDLSTNDMTFLKSSIFGSSIANIRYLHLSYNRIVALDQQFVENAESLMWLLLLGNDCLSRNYYNVPQEREQMNTELQQCFTNFIGSARCQYVGMLWFPYECLLFINNPVGNDFETIEGTHLTGKSDSDVLVIEALYQNSRNFPGVICRQFPNLGDIYIEETQIEILEADSFVGCRDLWSVVLAFNRIAFIPDGLFRNNPTLRVFEASMNEISHIGVNAFTGSEIRAIGLRNNHISEFNPHIFDPIADTLVELILSSNRMTSLPLGAFSRLNNLLELDLSHNNLTDIPADAFRYLTRLQRLLIMNCSINELNLEWFASLHALAELRMDNNNIREIPENIFTDIQQLTTFSIAGNSIRNVFGSSFGNLSNLTTFLAQSNGVRSFDREIFDQSVNLRTLNMDGNICANASYYVFMDRDLARSEMAHCFNMFDGFMNCTYYEGFLYMCRLTIQNVQGRNDFTEISGDHVEDFGNANVRFVDADLQDTRNIPSIICQQFPNLDEIYIQSSHIQIINEQTFEDCRLLAFLNLNENEITTIPDFTFINNPNIFTIEMFNNRISRIEPNAFAGLEVEMIDLEANLLTEIDGRWFTPSREYLYMIYLSYNRIRVVPEDAFENLDNLMILDLGFNPGITLPPHVFRQLQSLQRLHLDGCEISEINPLWFEGLQELRFLYLSVNQIDNLPAGVFDNLPNLYLIDVARNPITMIHSDSFGSTLSNLLYFYNDNNPTHSIDPEFFDGALSLNYLFLLQNECVNRNFYGVMFDRDSVRAELEDCFDAFMVRDPLRCNHIMGPNNLLFCLLTAHNPSGHNNYDEIEQGDGVLNANVGFLEASQQNTRIVPKIICDQYSNLQSISIVNSGVQRLMTDSFDNCGNLTQLRLNYNQISSIPAGILGNNRNLRELELMANRIHTIADDSFVATTLSILYIGNNRLTTFNRNMLNGVEETLTEIHVYINNLRTMPENSFEGLHNLQILDLGINTQIRLPSNIFQSLRNLSILYMDSNNIDTLNPDWFATLENLRELDLYRNNIRTLPENIFANLPSLTMLFIHENPIETLHASSFGDNLRNIQFINARGCRISAIDERLINDSDSLDILYLYDNMCVSSNFHNVFNDRDNVRERLQHCFDNFRGSIECHYDRNALQEYQCTMLISNVAGHNQFTEIVGDHQANTGNNDVLTVYTMYQNTRNIPSVICEQFSNLIEIFIEDSQVEMITVANCPHLQYLILAYNQISSIEAGTFANNPRLEYIDLHSNRIVSIADDVFAGSVLATINLGLNPLTTWNPAWTTSINETLKVLRLYEIRMTSVSESTFANLGELELLDMGINPNVIVPPGTFDNLEKLQSLYLDSNGLRRIEPQWFSNLQSLRDLHLNRNNLRELPASSFNNLNFFYLTIGNNRIAIINSNSFGNSLNTIESLYAQDNQIFAIDREFFDRAIDLDTLYLLNNVCVDHNFREVFGNRGFVREELRQCFENFDNLNLE